MFTPNKFVPETRLARARTGFYEIRYTERDSEGRARTRTQSTGTKDKAKAKLIERDFRVLSAQAAKLPTDLLVADVCDRYLTEHIEANGKGQTQHYSLLQVKRGFGDRSLAELTPAHVAHYRAKREKQVAQGTVRKELSAFRAALEWARKRGVIDPDFRLDFDVPADGAPRYEYLEEHEEKRMWGLAADLATSTDLPFPQRRVGLFICLALQTAARSGAIRGLTWDRVDFTSGLVDYRDPKKAKTRKRRVPVPMSKKLRPILEDAYKRRDPDSPYVLGHAGAVRGPFNRFCQRHGFHDTTIHDLRRTWATLRAQWGASMSDIAAVLGDTVQTTEKHYAHFAPGYLRSAVDMDGRC